MNWEERKFLAKDDFPGGSKQSILALSWLSKVQPARISQVFLIPTLRFVRFSDQHPELLIAGSSTGRATLYAVDPSSVRP
jgi:hypothetical protein